MKKSQLKQLIREVIEEVNSPSVKSRIKSMVDAIRKNPDIVGMVSTNTISEGAFGKKVGMLALAVAMMASGLSAKDVVNIDTPETLNSVMQSKNSSITDVAEASAKYAELIAKGFEALKTAKGKVERAKASGKYRLADGYAEEHNSAMFKLLGNDLGQLFSISVSQSNIDTSDTPHQMKVQD